MPSSRRSPTPGVAGALLLVALAFLAALGYQLRQQEAEEAVEPVVTAPNAPIELDRFSARLEKTNEGERLAVGLRLRASGPEPVDSFVFVVARTERGTPKQWAIWPADSPGMAISAGGHFHAAHPATGYALSLTGSWARVDAVLPVASGQPPFDSVVIYVVNASGNILLAHPFAL